MTTFSLVSAGAIRSLTCPYCHREMPRDEGGMFAAQASWGFCGAAAIEDGQVVGLLLVSAPAHADKSPAALVNSAWVDPEHADRGTGRHLVQTLAGGLVTARLGSLLASSAVTSGCAALPAGFLRSVGFAGTSRPGIWRMDLGQTVQDRGAVRSALERLISVVRPLAPPEPAGRTRSG